MLDAAFSTADRSATLSNISTFSVCATPQPPRAAFCPVEMTCYQGDLECIYRYRRSKLEGIAAIPQYQHSRHILDCRVWCNCWDLLLTPIAQARDSESNPTSPGPRMDMRSAGPMVRIEVMPS
jgi:hypothetical protein